jgi:hypothetical protein
MDRYYFTEKVHTRYQTARLEKPPVRDDDEYIFSREGDRFDLLAKEFYDKPEYWWIIAIANDIRPGSMMVPIGLQLRIPKNLDLFDLQLKKAEEDK